MAVRGRLKKARTRTGQVKRWDDRPHREKRTALKRVGSSLPGLGSTGRESSRDYSGSAFKTGGIYPKKGTGRYTGKNTSRDPRKKKK